MLHTYEKTITTACTMNVYIKNFSDDDIVKLSEELKKKCDADFVDLMRSIKEISNETFDALRVRTKDLRFIVAVIVDDKGNITGYRPGLIEATAEPEFLRRDAANPDNFTGAHYDKVYGDLNPHGLRLPKFPEYQVLFAMKKEMDGVSIDKEGWALLDIGERKDKSASVPVANGSFDKPNLNSFFALSNYPR